MFQTKVAEKTKTYISRSKTFFRKLCRLLHNVEKYCTVGQATDGNLAHAHCMLDTQDTNTQSEYVISISFPL